MFTVQDIALRRDEEKINNVVHWSEFDRGGHFAAMEAPTSYWTTSTPSSPTTVDL